MEHKRISITDIVAHPQNVNLRQSQGDTKGSTKEEYDSVKKSIEANHFKNGKDDNDEWRGGLTVPIIVTVATDDTGKPLPNTYWLVDGMQRWSIHKELNAQYPNKGFDFVQATIKPELSSNYDVMMEQVIANIGRVKTTPKQLAATVIRLEREAKIANRPFSIEEVAKFMGVNKQSVYQWLNLKRLNEHAMQAVQNDDLPVSNGTLLARVPEEFQTDFLMKYIEGDEVERQAWPIKVQDFLEARRRNKNATPDDADVFNPRSKAELLDMWANWDDELNALTAFELMQRIGRLDEHSKNEKKIKAETNKLKKDQEKLKKTQEELSARETKLNELQQRIADAERKAAQLGVN
jgi:hypothetical protein